VSRVVSAERFETVSLPATLRRDFAVVVPAHNEVENVPALVAALRETFERHGLAGEILLVDDGSTDGTAAVAEGAFAAWGYPQARVLRHRHNRGKTEALLTAAAATRATYLVLFDADLQHSTEEIPRFLAKLAEGWDIVTGRKVGPYEKRFVSRIYNALSRWLFRLPVRDLNSMKAFRRQIVEEIPLRHDWHRFFVALAFARGYSLTEIDIPLFPRRAGESKYRGWGRILVGWFDLLIVWFYLKFSEKPMQFFGGAGLALIVGGVLVGLVTVGLRLAAVQPPFGLRPLLMLVALMETIGFLLLGFGFLAEVVATLRSELAHERRRLSDSSSRTR